MNFIHSSQTGSGATEQQSRRDTETQSHRDTVAQRHRGKFLFVCFICMYVIVSIIPHNTYAQSDTTVRFIQPVNEQEAVPLMPQILIYSDWDIDSSSITYSYPNLDSNVYNNTTLPTMILLPDAIIDSLTLQQQKYFSIPSHYVRITKNLIQIQPIIPLSPDTKYRAKLVNLSIINSTIGDTVSAPVTQITFTTTQIPHYLLKNNYLTKSRIKCSDTLYFSFNRSIDTAYFSLDSILIVERIDSVNHVNDSIFSFAVTNKSMNIWLDQTGRRMYATPTTAFIPGEEYRIKIKTSFINADTIMDSEAIIQIEKFMIVELDNKCISPGINLPNTITYPQKGENLFWVGDTLKISAKDSYDSLAFVRFDIIDSNGDTIKIYENSFILIRDCDELDDILIQAVYDIKDTTQVEVPCIAGIKTSVYDSGFNFIGNCGIFNVGPDDYIVVTIDSSSYDAPFERFVRNDKPLGVLGSKMISIETNGGTRWIEIDIETGEPINSQNRPFHYGVSVVLEDISCKLLPNGPIYAFTGTPEDSPSLPFPELPTPKDVAVNIYTNYEDKYEIYKIVTINNGTSTETILGTPQSSWSAVLTATPLPGIDYIIYIRPVEYFDLTVETELIKYTLNSVAEVGDGKDVTIQICVNTCPSSNPIRIDYTTTEEDLVLTDIPSGTTIYMWAVKNPGFTSIWEDESPYFFPPNTGTNSNAITFIMDEDKLVKCTFAEHFRLEAIGIYKDDLPEDVEWITPLGLYAIQTKYGVLDDIEVNMFGYQSQFENGFGTKIHLKFNNEPDITSFYPTSEPYPLTVLELSDRVDNPAWKNHKYMSFQDFITVNITDPTIVDFMPIYNSTFGIPKGMLFSLDINRTSIRDIDDQQLSQIFSGGDSWKSSFKFYTEVPNVIATLKEIKAHEGSGDGGIELMGIITSSILNQKNATQVFPDPASQSAIQMGGYLDIGSWRQENLELINYWDMKRHYNLAMNFIFYDTDCDGEIEANYISDILYAAALGILIVYRENCVGEGDVDTPLAPKEVCDALWELAMWALFAAGVSEAGEELIELMLEGIILPIWDRLNEALGTGWGCGPDYLGFTGFMYPWNEYWFGASDKAKRINNFYNWRSTILEMKGEVKLRKKDAPWNDTETY